MSRSKKFLKQKIKESTETHLTEGAVKQEIEKKDKSPIVFQRNKIRGNLNIVQRKLTDKQNKFFELALNKDTKMILVNGPAGSTKTYMAVLCALTLLNDKKVSDLIYVRTAVESSDSKLGFLPGESKEKMAPYVEPLMDKLEELLPKQDIQFLQTDKRVSAVPVGFLRGLNWNAKVIISDESQNMCIRELTTLITRIGEFSKIYVCGDSLQSDINSKSGFKKMFDLFSDEESRKHGIYTFEFTEEDILRSEFVKFIVGKLKTLKI